MALGCAVVVPDCVGNRAYLEPGNNALVPDMALDALVQAVDALDDDGLVEQLVAAAQSTVARFGMDRERDAFHAVLDELDALWNA